MANLDAPFFAKLSPAQTNAHWALQAVTLAMHGDRALRDFELADAERYFTASLEAVKAAREFLSAHSQGAA